MKLNASSTTDSVPVPPVDANMPLNNDESNAKFCAAVAKLGAGYKGRRSGARGRSLTHETGQPAAVSIPAEEHKADGDDSVAKSALGKGYHYRRPVPLPDEEDAMALGEQEAQEESAPQALETGSVGAAGGPLHEDGNAGGGVVEGDGLSTAGSSHYSTALTNPSPATENVVEFANDWDGQDGKGEQDGKAGKLASSSDPADFQDAREASRSLLSAGAFFASMGKGMLDEHKRARKEADYYMTEVT